MKKIFIFMLLAVCAIIPAQAQYQYLIETSNGNYSRAAELLERQINPNSIISVNLADDYVFLAMLKWNCGEKSDAVYYMKKAIHVMKYGRDISESGCEKRAETFLEKMQRNRLPGRFSEKDFYSAGVHGYIMDPVRAESQRRVSRNINYYQRQGAMIDGMRRSQRYQFESNARIAKSFARSKYFEKTHDTFNPNNPPPRGSEKREYWDSCKRIHDIFND